MVERENYDYYLLVCCLIKRRSKDFHETSKKKKTLDTDKTAWSYCDHVFIGSYLTEASIKNFMENSPKHKA